MKLSKTEKNAIWVIITLITFLIGLGVSRSETSTIYFTIPLIVSFIGGFLTGYFITGIYESTMRGSIPILKSSLFLSLTIAFFSALMGAPTLGIVAILFTITPILYDFFRDIILPNDQQDIPWGERRISTRIFEIFLEALMSSIIGLIIIYFLTGKI